MVEAVWLNPGRSMVRVSSEAEPGEEMSGWWNVENRADGLIEVEGSVFTADEAKSLAEMLQRAVWYSTEGPRVAAEAVSGPLMGPVPELERLSTEQQRQVREVLRAYRDRHMAEALRRESGEETTA